MYEESVQRLDTPRMWQMYVDTLFELHANDFVRPRIRLRLYGACQRGFESKKLSDHQVVNWVKHERVLIALAD